MKISKLIRDHKRRFLLMLALVLIDAGLLVLFPLFIGFAIDDALVKTYEGAVYLGLLGLATLLIGAFRRFYDSRFYAKIYEKLGAQIGDREDISPTTKSAHLRLLNEVVEFLENSLPQLVNSSLGLIGTLIIIGTLNLKILAGCMVILLIVLLVYGLSVKKTIRLNAGYNDELECQVDMISEHQPILLRNHLRKLMKWNIRLSDLETVNFSVVWLFMMAFLVLSIIMAINEGMASYGAVFALVLYLFQFIETAIVMPLFYQQWLRLKEITGRLTDI
ncbi:MAG: hypothetical protein HEP71_22390 [Roseivirga sp.]|nr:hypothetical protein [Roseivirga sp.]